MGVRAVCYAVLTLAAVVALGTVSGCAKPTPRPAAKPEPQLRAKAQPRFLVRGGLQSKLAFAKPEPSGGSEYPLEISVPVRLRASTARDVHYRFVFYDQQGRVLKPRMDWRHAKLPANERLNLKGSATTTAARDWQLLIEPY